MIEFDCPHCGNHFRVEETLGGRHGWCRLCKGFIVVPTARSRMHWEDLPAEQRVVRLEKILRSTTELYNAQHEELLALQRTLTEHAEAVERAHGIAQHLEQVAPRLEQAERDITRLSQELSQAAEAKGAANANAERATKEYESIARSLAESEAACEALAAELKRAEGRMAEMAEAESTRESLLAERDSLRRRLEEREADLHRLQGGAEGSGSGDDGRQLLEQLDQARADRDAAAANQAKAEAEVRQLERSLAAVSADASRWQSEAERLGQSERQLTEIRAKWDEAQNLVRELHPGIAQAHEARGRAESEAAEAKSRASRLEEKVSRLTEDNEAQREAIAALRRDVEQARALAKVAEGEAESARDTLRRQDAELARLREAEVHAAQLAPVSAERDQFRDRLIEADAQVMRLKEELASFAGEAVAGTGQAASAHEREALRAELTLTQQAKADAERHGQEMATEMRQLQARLEQVLADRDRLIEEVTGLQEKGARFDSLLSDLSNAHARLEESQRQVERLTERLANAGGSAAYGRSGAGGRSRGYDAPVIPESDSRDIALIPEVVDEEGLQRSQELMASMLRFIEPRDRES